MDFGNLLFNLQCEERTSVRKVESLNKKLITSQLAVIFNKICIKENLLPKYTDIYMYIYISVSVSCHGY